ncbi:MAG TPA: phosphonate ABC transporter ATP-binding protein [Candidatus Kapabacteria bacterium]|nr:phosphonate ABC transporter ATP-binding protein [Candidatus Kapabacteria bacterium]
MQMKRTGLLMAMIALAFMASTCTTERPANEVVIGLNPSERSENVQKNADVLARLISERSGLNVKIFVAQDYSGLVEALRGRTIDFAFFAPVSYVFAERIAGARVLLKAERKGKPYYYGCIVVNADSSYRTLADLKGRNIAWVDPTSASGHIFPKAALVEAGIDPETFFAKQTFAGGHDAVLLSVINGTISAGATYANDTAGEDGSWTQLGKGAFKGRIRPIFYSPPIPGDNLATTQHLIDTRPEIVRKIRDAVAGLTDNPAGRQLMQQMYHVDAMIPAAGADYDPVRRAADLLKLDITGTIGGSGGRASPAAGTATGTAQDQGEARNELVSTIAFITFGLLGAAFLAYQTIRERRARGPRGRAAPSGSRSARPGSQATPSGGQAAVPAVGSPQNIAVPESGQLRGSNVQFAVRNLSVIYPDKEGRSVQALTDIDLEIVAGEFVAVIGLSGAGKSTLLRCLNRMNRPASGAIFFEGREITYAQGSELAAIRRRIGFVFQQFNLVKNVSVMKNVLGGRLAHVSWLDSMLGRFPKKDRDIALRYIREVGLAEKVRSRAANLSGGQQQRVAIARALAQQPSVILADEPMASLDPKLAEIVLGMLRRFNREEGITVIVNLHVLELARHYADRIIALRAGEVVFDGSPAELSEEVVERIYRTDAEGHRAG